MAKKIKNEEINESVANSDVVARQDADGADLIPAFLERAGKNEAPEVEYVQTDEDVN